jgi:hypothetical protein
MDLPAGDEGQDARGDRAPLAEGRELRSSFLKAEAGSYYATIFAEKREPVLIDTRAVEAENRRIDKLGRRIDVTAKASLWLTLVLVLLVVLFFSWPLLKACRALF